MKIYKAFFLLLGVLTACKKDFLQVQDGRRLSREHVVVNLATTEQYLNGIYTMIASDLYKYPNIIYPELIADNVKPIDVGAYTMLPHYKWAQSANEEYREMDEALNVNLLSYSLYKVIRNSCFVLDKANEFRKDDPGKSEVIKGQAYVIRALCHFWLVNVYAQPYKYTSNGTHWGIAYVTSYDYTDAVKRLTVADVYNKIIEDLNAAIENLPETMSSKLVIGRNFAKALLARVYLFKEDYQAAKNMAREVCDKVPLMLVNYPEKLYTPEETEALFQIAPERNYYTTLFSGLYYSSSYQLQFLATNDIAEMLQENLMDKRSKWVENVSGEWHIKKFPSNVISTFPMPAGAYYQTVMRSSEMYLIAAEAYAKINNADSANFFLNEIRMRANPTGFPILVSGEALIDSVYKERRKELAFDGIRMFDLLRWEKGVERHDVSNGGANYLPYPSNKAIAPIPLLDVELSGVSQNLGY